MLGVVLLPGLLAAGIGSLIFLGLDSLTGLGTLSLAIPGLPPFGHPTVAMFGWAIVIRAGRAVPRPRRSSWLAVAVRPHAERRACCSLMPLLGLAIAGLAIAFGEATDQPASEVLFSGQAALGPLVESAELVGRRAAAARAAARGSPTACR